MNKFLTTLVAASLTALFIALGCGAWLFWQSWEETRKLERQNRELQATLEASRIRLDNFCEYPMEALCDVDAGGSVSSAMSGLHEGLPEPSPVLPAQPPVPERPISSPPSSPAEESQAAIPAPKPADTQQPSSEKSLPAPKEEQPVPEVREKTPDQPEAPAPAAVKQPSEPAAPKNEEGVASETPQEPQAPAAPPKKTWTTLEQTPDSLKLRIAGAGSSLTAQGKELADPLRYEVTLQGLWKIAPKRLETTLVTDIRREFCNGDTVLTFLLSRQPAQCLLEQEDARTIAIIIE